MAKNGLERSFMLTFKDCILLILTVFNLFYSIVIDIFSKKKTN